MSDHKTLGEIILKELLKKNKIIELKKIKQDEYPRKDY